MDSVTPSLRAPESVACWLRAYLLASEICAVPTEDTLPLVPPALRDWAQGKRDGAQGESPQDRASRWATEVRALSTKPSEISSEQLASLGAWVVASMVQSTAPSHRSSIARRFSHEVLRGAAREAGRACACESVLIGRALDVLESEHRAQLTLEAIGALAHAALGEDLGATRPTLGALRWLRAHRTDPARLFSVFAHPEQAGEGPQ
ncbi:MAG: hypothetical protein Q8Q09_14485 [Deltaproteobacteria bacterium]|nr:hypothetical protein [Deltaproteobacteria bacterium]